MKKNDLHTFHRNLKNNKNTISRIALKLINTFRNIINIYFKIRSRIQIRKKLKFSSKKLHIGCGPNLLPNWINTDLNYKKGAVYLDASKKMPFESNSFDYIFSEHVFEHLSFSEEKNMLQESFRILKRGGVLRLSTPDIDFLFQLYKDNKGNLHEKYIKWSAENFIPEIYKDFSETDELNIFVINNFFKDWGHKIIHSYSSLYSMLKNTGFKSIKKVRVGESDFSELKGIESHGKSISEEFNNLESLVIEAIKC